MVPCAGCAAEVADTAVAPAVNLRDVVRAGGGERLLSLLALADGEPALRALLRLLRELVAVPGFEPRFAARGGFDLLALAPGCASAGVVDAFASFFRATQSLALQRQIVRAVFFAFDLLERCPAPFLDNSLRETLQTLCTARAAAFAFPDPAFALAPLRAPPANRALRELEFAAATASAFVPASL
jgi:hypothetical protein